MMKKYPNLRINLFLGIILLSSSLILYRLFVLSVVRHSAYSLTAKAQKENINNILARGNIYLSDQGQNLFLAATNKKFPLAHIVPRDIEAEARDKAIDLVAEILGLNSLDVKSQIDFQSKSLKVLARRITNEQVDRIKNLKLKGVGVSYEADRFYPGSNLASNVIGFLGYDYDGKRAGQYGVEGYYDRELSGRNQNLSGLLNSKGPMAIFKKISGTGSGSSSSQEFDRPSDLVLTIDKNAQTFIEKQLEDITKKWQAEAGTIIVQEPESGRIIAMADWPNFNPNSYAATEPKLFLNSGIQEIYEPGSSFKPVTMATGLDLLKITPQTSYEDNGFVNIAGYTIHNFSDRVFGIQTMTQVLENSVNTGIMFVENLVGDDNFLNYVINMGFGQKTGIDLPGEVSGDVNNLYSGRKINYLTSSFGQGIAVTPMQLINAYSVIANGGRLMRPYIVERIIKEGGEEVKVQPEVVGIPISEKTAVKLQSMLVSVVDNGFDKARIKGYDVAGKTGTAQVPDGSGGYSEKEFIHNFVGFAPAYNAKFVVLIKMDKPKGIQFAADSLSPVFKEITAFLLNYYNIPPTRK